jgi:hypothetical protein
MKPPQYFQGVRDLKAQRIKRLALDWLHRIDAPKFQRAVAIDLLSENEKGLIAEREEWPSQRYPRNEDFRISSVAGGLSRPVDDETLAIKPVGLAWTAVYRRCWRPSRCGRRPAELVADAVGAEARPWRASFIEREHTLDNLNPLRQTAAFSPLMRGLRIEPPR